MNSIINEYNEKFPHTQEKIKYPKEGIDKNLIEIKNEKDEKLIEILECPCCLNLVWEPVDCQNCKNIFCNSCAQNIVEKYGNKCPMCNISPFNFSKAFFAKKVLDLINIKCINEGCNEILNYSNYLNHLKICSDIKYACKNNGCSFSGSKLMMENHINKCPFRKVRCEKCNRLIKLNKEENHKNKICSEGFKECPVCQMVMKRKIYNKKHKNTHNKEEFKNKLLNKKRKTNNFEDVINEKNISNIFDNGDVIQIVYKIDKYEDVQIFGDGFVYRNEEKCNFYINSKKYYLCEKIDGKRILINDDSPYFTLYLTGIKKITDFSFMFKDCSSLISISNIPNFEINTQHVTNMESMFERCISLTSLDLSFLNTENVTDMSYMFRHCTNLKSLNLKSFNTQNVMYMDHMFEDCISLTAIDLSSFRTENVKSMRGMFLHCASLISLDLKSFKPIKLPYMDFMFCDCFKLKSLDLFSFNAENFKNQNYIFSGCKSLTSVKLV